MGQHPAGRSRAPHLHDGDDGRLLSAILPMLPVEVYAPGPGDTLPANCDFSWREEMNTAADWSRVDVPKALLGSFLTARDEAAGL